MTIDDAMRARIRAQYGDGIPEDPRVSSRPKSVDTEAAPAPTKPKRDASAEASKRQKTGRKFEIELDDTHGWLLNARHGHILPHYPPTVWRGTSLAYVAGGGPCDYSGHLNIAPALAAGVPVLGTDDGVQRVPVVFDAKVVGEGHASYRHDPKRIAQLHALKAAASTCACAFILVRADEVGRAFVIGWREHGDDLVRGRSVKMFEKHRAGWRIETRLGAAVKSPRFEVFPLLPSVAYVPGLGWPWWRALGPIL